jgi:hypothetical protein
MDLSHEKLRIIAWVMRQDQPEALRAVIRTMDQADYSDPEKNAVIGFRGGEIPVSLAGLSEIIAEARRIPRDELIPLEHAVGDSETW